MFTAHLTITKRYWDKRLANRVSSVCQYYDYCLKYKYIKFVIHNTILTTKIYRYLRLLKNIQVFDVFDFFLIS